MMPKEYKLGFIGAGNMATSIISGVIRKEVAPENVYVYDVDREKAAKLCTQYGLSQCTSNEQLATQCDVIFLATKPNVIESVIQEIREFAADKLVVSIAAGYGAADLRSSFGLPVRLLRVMPNTPALAGEGMCVISNDHTLDQEDLAVISRLLSTVGRVAMVPDDLMDAVTGLSGSGPAFVYLFIEAMADAGVLRGLPRSLAIEMAAQTVLGSAKMVLQTGKHPGLLKDEVCSPGGTTIEGVFALENGGFRAAVMQAVDAATEKSVQLSKKD
ncbi:MAG: pyrroline-5-carboxylate reductase [Christensenellales bacterium]|jgi:pyrroline-5-carboxylate reductase